MNNPKLRQLSGLLPAGAVISSMGLLHAAPSPDPMTFDAVPTQTSKGEVTMTATTATDPNGVEYFFTETSGNPGGDDSGWQASPTYTDDGLDPGTTYTYNVKARDAVGFIETAASGDESVTTDTALIYEGFDYTGAINAQTGGFGFGGAWANTKNSPTAETPDLTWGDLSTVGRHLRGAAWSGVVRPIGTTLSDAGLMDDGSTLWFSVIFDLEGQNTSNADMNFALCSDKFVSGDFGDKENLNSGEGIGVSHSGATIQGVYWTNLDADAVGERTENNSSVNINGVGANLDRALIVGKISWGVDGSADETLTLYGPPDTDLTQGAPIMAEWTVPALDQSVFDQISLQFKDNPKMDEIRFGASYNEVVTWDFGTNPDSTAPTPDPMTFEIGPTGVTDTILTMTADEATDPSGVEYSFTCTVGGGPDSGWQASRVFNATGLTASTNYTYTVKARDLSPALNQTADSAPVAGSTLAPDSVPPTPNPMTFAVNPAAISDTEISMEASVATDDVFGVEYNFICTVGGGPDSGWQSGTSYTATGLTPNTLYTYTVTARDTSPGQNEGTASGGESASTLPTDNTAPTPDPASWVTAPTVVSDTEVTMTATTATDDQYGVEYYFTNHSVPSGANDSGWQASSTYNDTGLMPFTSYTYSVKVRDTSYAQNEGAASAPTPVVTNADPAVTTPSLIDGQHHIVASANSGGANFDVSVFAGAARYSGTTGALGAVYSHFGDGTAADYNFFRESGGAIVSYAAGSGGLISVPTATTVGGNNSYADLWTASDPGADFALNPADETNNTMVSGGVITGSIDISGMTEGTVYFIYGAYRSQTSFDLTMSGSGQPDVTLNNVGDNDFSNNQENYVYAANFLNAGDYDTISYSYTSNQQSRWLAGVVVEGVVTTPSNPYTTWAATNAPGQTPEEDFDLDGVENGVEFVLGGDKDTNDLDKLPGATVTGGNLEFSFERDQASIAAGVAVTIEVGTDLSTWPTVYTVGADTAGSSAGITVDKDTPGSGTDTVTLSVAQGGATKMFARLKVVITP